MRKETKFYAFDDTEFDSEDECLVYEKRAKSFLCGARFFDEECKELVVDLDNPEPLEYAFFAHILDASAAASLFSWLKEYTGMDIPNGEFHDNDLWYYDDDRYEWVNATEMMKKLTEIVKKISAAELKGA